MGHDPTIFWRSSGFHLGPLVTRPLRRITTLSPTTTMVSMRHPWICFKGTPLMGILLVWPYPLVVIPNEVITLLAIGFEVCPSFGCPHWSQGLWHTGLAILLESYCKHHAVDMSESSPSLPYSSTPKHGLVSYKLSLNLNPWMNGGEDSWKPLDSSPSNSSTNCLSLWNSWMFHSPLFLQDPPP